MPLHVVRQMSLPYRTTHYIQHTWCTFALFLQKNMRYLHAFFLLESFKFRFNDSAQVSRQWLDLSGGQLSTTATQQLTVHLFTGIFGNLLQPASQHSTQSFYQRHISAFHNQQQITINVTASKHITRPLHSPCNAKFFHILWSYSNHLHVKFTQLIHILINMLNIHYHLTRRKSLHLEGCSTVNSIITIKHLSAFVIPVLMWPT